MKIYVRRHFSAIYLTIFIIYFGLTLKILFLFNSFTGFYTTLLNNRISLSDIFFKSFVAYSILLHVNKEYILYMGIQAQLLQKFSLIIFLMCIDNFSQVS